MKKITAAFLLVFSLAAAARAEDRWIFLPGQTFDSMLRGGGVAIMSSETLRWQDGRNVMVTYLRTADNVFRCINYQEQPMQQSGLGCYRLAK